MLTTGNINSWGSTTSAAASGVDAGDCVYSDLQRVAPVQGFEADHSGRVQHDKTGEAVSSPAVVSSASVRTNAVVNFEGASFDDDSHAEAVGDTDASEVRTRVGRAERRHGVGDVLW